MTNIVTPEGVQDVTGFSVARDLIAQAQAIIDLVCGHPLDDITDVTARDQNRLKLAVAYQAVWMDSHPEVFSTMNVSAVNQDGLQVTFRDDPEANLIAPLARAAISRLTWRGQGLSSTSVTSVFQTNPYCEQWRPIKPYGSRSAWR